MTEWLLLVVLLTGAKDVRVESIVHARYETQDACEIAGAKYKTESRKRAAFACIEVARARR